MLVGLGIPVDLLNWFDEDDRNFEYAPIDNDSRETLNDLKRIRNSALKI
jgi:centrosomal protein CEP104